MNKPAKVALAVGALLSLQQVALAEKFEMPQKGSADYVTFYTFRTLAKLSLEQVGSGDVFELVGVTQNSDEETPFDNLSVRCLYYHETVADKDNGNGVCTETDSDGDKIFSTFDANAQTHTLIGGTGKYKGITGTASFTKTPLPDPGQGLGALVVKHKVSWEYK
jgi:hypothetical protein